MGSVTVYAGDGNSPIYITRHKLCVSDNEILHRRMHKSLSTTSDTVLENVLLTTRFPIDLSTNTGHYYTISIRLWKNVWPTKQFLIDLYTNLPGHSYSTVYDRRSAWLTKCVWLTSMRVVTLICMSHERRYMSECQRQCGLPMTHCYTS